MVGAVFGNTNGVAPGYKGSLAWRAVELSSEAQYVFDVGDRQTTSSTRGRSSPWRQLTGAASA